jgi:hypothetical protein
MSGTKQPPNSVRDGTNIEHKPAQCKKNLCSALAGAFDPLPAGPGGELNSGPAIIGKRGQGGVDAGGTVLGVTVNVTARLSAAASASSPARPGARRDPRARSPPST